MGLFSLLALTLVQMDEKPTASVKLASGTATVGKPLKGTLTLAFPEGLHGYQNPPSDEFEIPIKITLAESGFKLGQVDYPKGVEMRMEGAEKPTKVYEGTIAIPFILSALPRPRTTPKSQPWDGKLSFKVDYQLCNATSCFPPGSITIRIPLKVAATPVKAKAAKKP